MEQGEGPKYSVWGGKLVWRGKGAWIEWRVGEAQKRAQDGGVRAVGPEQWD